MKNFQFILITISFIVQNSCKSGLSQNQAGKLTPIEFSEKIKSTNEAQLVDVRTPEEYAKGHLENAKNIDWNGSIFKEEISKLDKTKPVFVYCMGGGRSSQAAGSLRENGFKEVYDLSGGIMRWRAENFPEANMNASKGMSKQQFDQLLTDDKIVLVDFYAEWCAPCKKMKPYLDDIKNNMQDKVSVIRINADDNQALCKELKVDGLPVLHVYKKKILSWSHTGFIEKEEVLAQLK